MSLTTSSHFYFSSHEKALKNAALHQRTIFSSDIFNVYSVSSSFSRAVSGPRPFYFHLRPLLKRLHTSSVLSQVILVWASQSEALSISTLQVLRMLQSQPGTSLYHMNRTPMDITGSYLLKTPHFCNLHHFFICIQFNPQYHRISDKNNPMPSS